MADLRTRAAKLMRRYAEQELEAVLFYYETTDRDLDACSPTGRRLVPEAKERRQRLRRIFADLKLAEQGEHRGRSI